jgi:hypothetical protein
MFLRAHDRPKAAHTERSIKTPPRLSHTYNRPRQCRNPAGRIQHDRLQRPHCKPPHKATSTPLDGHSVSSLGGIK